MKRSLRLIFVVLTIVSFSLILHARLDEIVIAAGTPEDQALQAITNEQDGQKKLAMYQDFLQKFSSNPGTCRRSETGRFQQYYQGAGDLPKALDYGDKALASSPHNVDILVSQTNIAQQMKDDPDSTTQSAAEKPTTPYSKEAEPEGLSDQEFTCAWTTRRPPQKFVRISRSCRIQHDCQST